MADIWFVSDTHFFHENILRFKDGNGQYFRGQLFSSAKEMNECIVQNWNEAVKPQDKVYHLGDVAVGVKEQSEATSLVYSLNGHKRLILGNHDHLEAPMYRAFERIELWTGGKFKQYGFVASHIPLRLDSMRDGAFNVHGHIHQNLVRRVVSDFHPFKRRVSYDEGPDPHYINVCVEQTDYKPIHLDEIIARIKNRGGHTT